MSEASSAPQWVWILITVASLVVVVSVGWLVGGWLWHRFSRRYLVQLIGRRENFIASQRTLEAVIRHLADEPEESLLEFAQDPGSPDRQAFFDVAHRMQLLADEAWTTPLPKRLWPLGQALGDAAATLAMEAGSVSEDMDADGVLTALASVNVERVTRAFEEAVKLMTEAREYYDIDDTAVYGGGLYI